MYFHPFAQEAARQHHSPDESKGPVAYRPRDIAGPFEGQTEHVREMSLMVLKLALSDGTRPTPLAALSSSLLASKHVRSLRQRAR